MSELPSRLLLTRHARERLKERGCFNIYNEEDLMKSNCKWYTKDDFIPQSKLYIHAIYVCRKSKDMGYLTDGNIEVLYNRATDIVITIIEVKDKFTPITQYIKPEIVNKENRIMKTKIKLEANYCTDCEEESNEIYTSGIYAGLCKRCRQRKINAKARKKEYIPYKDLSDEEREKIEKMKQIQIESKERKEALENIVVPGAPTTIPVIENYYQVKAEQNPAIAQVKEIPVPHLTGIVDNTDTNTVKKDTFDPLSDQASFVAILRECGCEIPQEDLQNVLNVLVNTDKLKNIFMTIAKDNSQQAMLDLEQALNVVERKLQHNWEYNGFQEVDELKFKGFLTWRRTLKGAIYFWKKLYSTNTIIEMQRAWNAYTQDPNEKILMAGDKIESSKKRFQITTESISTIFNTRKPFTRVFYAIDKDEAYSMFKQWMADRQLHEDPKKTTIVELKSEGTDGRKENN